MLSLNNIIVGVKVREEKRLRGQNGPIVFIKQSIIIFELKYCPYRCITYDVVLLDSVSRSAKGNTTPY